MTFLYCSAQVCFKGVAILHLQFAWAFLLNHWSLPPCFFTLSLHSMFFGSPLTCISLHLEPLWNFFLTEKVTYYLFLGPGFVWNTIACVCSYFGSLSRLYPHWDWDDYWCYIWWTPWRRYDMSWEECQHIVKYVLHLYITFSTVKNIVDTFGKCFNNYC